MIRRPQISTLTDTLLPYTTLVRSEGRTGEAGDDRGGQNPVRRRGRSAGDDRHLRLRGRAFAAIIRADDRDRTARPPDDGGLASADRKSTRLTSTHSCATRMPYSA